MMSAGCGVLPIWRLMTPFGLNELNHRNIIRKSQKIITVINDTIESLLKVFLS